MFCVHTYQRGCPSFASFCKAGYHGTSPLSLLITYKPCANYRVWGLAKLRFFACIPTKEAAPAFLLLESWAPRNSPSKFIGHIQALTFCANSPLCPTNFIATTARGICTSLPPVVTSELHCSPVRSIAICCLRFWSKCGGGTALWWPAMWSCPNMCTCC